MEQIVMGPVEHVKALREKRKDQIGREQRAPDD